LREKFPNSKIIILHIDKSFPPPDGLTNTAVFYAAESGGTGVQDFLEKEAPETEAANIKIIEWRASLNYYKEAYVNLVSQVVDFIKRSDAGKRTEAAFGARWVSNFFRNLDIVNQTLMYKAVSAPVIITGSGPSLEQAIPIIQKMQDSSLIIAASSSLLALSHGGIKADIVIATDGGAWALRHIYPFYRNKEADRGAFAANLCAALPSQCRDTPFLVINDGSFWQSVILHELAIPSVIIPQKGTVTASAIELALALSGANIYLAGMDLGVKDIRSHARPYAFDHLQFDKADRFTPVYSQSFLRSRLIHEGGSLDIYAAWFKKQFASWPQGRILPIEKAQSGKKKETAEWFKAVPVKSGDFKERGARALIAALKGTQYAKEIRGELVPLLFPGEKEVSDKKLEMKIREEFHAEDAENAERDLGCGTHF
jgi:hypothetical protein